MRIALSFVVLACTVASVADDVVYNASNQTQTLKVGDTLTFKLDALPGAGYSWQPTTTGRANLKYVSVKTLPQTKGRLGGKQMMVLRFLATATGDATVTLLYGRPWLLKKGEKPEKTLTASVAVN
jgi:predicted secreted protein